LTKIKDIDLILKYYT